MKTRDFYFELPHELIAQYPAPRGESRLMTLNRANGEIGHYGIKDLPELLPENAVAVFNNSRVRKARLYAADRETGGRAEFLLLSRLSQDAGRDWTFMCNKSKRLKPGRVFVFPENLSACIAAGGDAADGGLVLRFERPLSDDYLERCGRMPLPPYIRRPACAADDERYQTVYAGPSGSAAAPTAGLHFTPRLLSALDARGLARVMVTLHVGPGTFLPVRSALIEEHTMHSEDYSVSAEAAETVNRGKKEGRPILAVGTTSVRVLESAWRNDGLASGEASTRIFIYPGYRFKAADMLFTNFHTPQSTLLMLVSAFAGRELILKAYEEAIKEKYRFFSYGDAMLIF
jgi:S-adenosylmethionine:tRNA ribosyltransferase-isomerase